MNSYYFVSWDWWSLRRGRVVSYGVRSPEEQSSLLVCATPHLPDSFGYLFSWEREPCLRVSCESYSLCRTHNHILNAHRVEGFAFIPL